MINIEELNRLLTDEFAGNQSEMAKRFGIERSHLNKILRNNGSGAGRLVVAGILSYCEETGRDYKAFLRVHDC